ncbi:MAG: response regulator [Alphaproteobacteria bacterium]
MPNRKYHLLVVDDDQRLADLLQRFLTENGFQVSAVGNVPEARSALHNFAFDLIVLDIMMPGETGLDFLKELRDKNDQRPVLMLTAMGEVEDRIEGLEGGADDYLGKPFEPAELLLRIKSLLKRVVAKTESNTINFGAFTFSRKKETLTKNDGSEIHLTSAEKQFMQFFMKHLDVLVSRDDLIEALQMPDNPRTIDVQIARLRRKIEADPKYPKHLQTVRSKGYIFKI